MTFSFVLTMCAMSSGQSIHWLVFVDTTSPDVGSVDVVGQRILFNKFINPVNEALAGKGYKTVIHRFVGKQCTPHNCKKAVEELSCESRDIVLFYYIGHGERPLASIEYNKNNPWPQFKLAQDNADLSIPMHWVHQRLKSKGARLTVTIGMCCNTPTPFAKRKDSPEFLSSKYRTISKTFAKRIQKLFLNNRGDIEISSASFNQRSYTYDFPDYGEIDAFTGVLTRVFQNYSITEQQPTWSSFLQEIKSGCSQLTYNSQIPFYRINLK